MKMETQKRIGQNIFFIASQLQIIIKCAPRAEPDPTWHALDSYTTTSATACDWFRNRAGLEKGGRMVVFKMYVFVFKKNS